MSLISPDQFQSLDVLQRLTYYGTQLTKAQKTVADYLTDHMMEAAFSTVDKIAHTTGVSTTTVVRLALTLGYSGYAELQGALKKYLTTMSSPLHMFSSTVSNPADGEEDQDSFSYMMEVEIQNLRETCAALSAAQVDKAAQALCDARSIYVVGARTCQGTAHYLAYNLDRMFLNTRYMDNNINDAPEIINRMDANDVLIYIGFSRYVKSIGEITRLAKGHEVTVIGITDSQTSPWRPYTDFMFVCANQSSNFFHSPLAVIYVANVLLRECSKKSGNRIKESLNKLEATTQALQLFAKK